MAVFQGWKAPDTFYERLNSMLGNSFLFFVLGFWMLVTLMVWVTLRACHWKLSWVPIAAFAVLFQWCMYTWTQLYVNDLPLELFHLPRAFRLQVRSILPNRPADAPARRRTAARPVCEGGC